MNIEVKTAELIGPALRYAVAVACGWKMQRIEDGDWKEGEPHWWQAINEKAVVPGKSNGLVGYIKPGAKGATSGYDYCPDVQWSQGGPLIEKYGVLLSPPKSMMHVNGGPNAGWRETGTWGSTIFGTERKHRRKAFEHPDQPLVAAMRAIVQFELGDVVSVPAELVQQLVQQLVECDHCPTSGGCVGVCMKAQQPIES